MIAKTDSSKGVVSPQCNRDAPGNLLQAAAGSMDERLQRIAALGQRINGYIQFICAAGGLNGTSTEAKERAVAAFYERMVLLEGQLSRIQDELKCG